MQHVSADYCFRTFQISYGKETRKVSHISCIRCREQYRIIVCAKLCASISGGTSALHCLARTRCAIVHTFANHVFEEVVGDIVWKRMRRGPLQFGRRQNRSSHFMRHLSPSSSCRRSNNERFAQSVKAVWILFASLHNTRLLGKRYDPNSIKTKFAEKENNIFQVIDVFGATVAIRNERAKIIYSVQQYLLAHLALMECLLSKSTALPCDKTLLTEIDKLKEQLPSQQERYSWLYYGLGLASFFLPDSLADSFDNLQIREHNLARCSSKHFVFTIIIGLQSCEKQISRISFRFVSSNTRNLSLCRNNSDKYPSDDIAQNTIC